MLPVSRSPQARFGRHCVSSFGIHAAWEEPTCQSRCCRRASRVIMARTQPAGRLKAVKARDAVGRGEVSLWVGAYPQAAPVPKELERGRTARPGELMFEEMAMAFSSAPSGKSTWHLAGFSHADRLASALPLLKSSGVAVPLALAGSGDVGPLSRVGGFHGHGEPGHGNGFALDTSFLGNATGELSCSTAPMAVSRVINGRCLRCVPTDRRSKRRVTFGPLIPARIQAAGPSMGTLG